MWRLFLFSFFFFFCKGNLSWKVLKLQVLVLFRPNPYNSSLFALMSILLLYGAIYRVSMYSVKEISVSAAVFAMLSLHLFLQIYFQPCSELWKGVFVGARMAAASPKQMFFLGYPGVAWTAALGLYQAALSKRGWKCCSPEGLSAWQHCSGYKATDQSSPQIFASKCASALSRRWLPVITTSWIMGYFGMEGISGNHLEVIKAGQLEQVAQYSWVSPGFGEAYWHFKVSPWMEIP